MKRFSSFVFILFFLITVPSSVGHAAAANTSSTQAEAAAILTKFGIIDSSKTSSKILKSLIKRHEYITLAVKLHGYDSDEDTGAVNLPYKDIDKSHKAYNNIKIAYKYGIISNDESSKLLPDGNIKYADALEMVLNSLGYANTIKGLSAEDIIKKASELKVCTDINLSPGKQLTYAEAYMIIYNSLIVDYNAE